MQVGNLIDVKCLNDLMESMAEALGEDNPSEKPDAEASDPNV